MKGYRFIFFCAAHSLLTLFPGISGPIAATACFLRRSLLTTLPCFCSFLIITWIENTLCVHLFRQLIPPSINMLIYLPSFTYASASSFSLHLLSSFSTTLLFPLSSVSSLHFYSYHVQAPFNSVYTLSSIGNHTTQGYVSVHTCNQFSPITTINFHLSCFSFNSLFIFFGSYGSSVASFPKTIHTT